MQGQEVSTVMGQQIIKSDGMRLRLHRLSWTRPSRHLETCRQLAYKYRWNLSSLPSAPRLVPRLAARYAVVPKKCRVRNWGTELSGWKRYEVNHDRFEWFYAAKRALGIW